MISSDQGGHRSNNQFSECGSAVPTKGGGIPSYRPWKYLAALFFIDPAWNRLLEGRAKPHY